MREATVEEDDVEITFREVVISGKRLIVPVVILDKSMPKGEKRSPVSLPRELYRAMMKTAEDAIRYKQQAKVHAAAEKSFF